MSSTLRIQTSLVCCLLLVGCSRNPNVEIVGSYFPGWLISLVLGIALTGVAHMFLRRKALMHSVGHPAMIYPSLVVLFTTLLWLCFFA